MTGRARFGGEPADAIRVGSESLVEHFHRDVASEPCVAAAIDLAHAAGAEQRNDVVGAELLAYQRPSAIVEYACRHLGDRSREKTFRRGRVRQERFDLTA